VIIPESGLRQEVSDALLFAHGRLNANAGRTLEASAFLYALIELLNEKGLISIEELDARKAKVAERLTTQYRELGQGVVVQDPETDKYSFEASPVIDCASKVAFCRASCCRLPFALSKQDISERLVQWDFSRPYLIAQGPNNYCVHLDAETKCCSIREHRPVPCRGYDCRKDERIWVDFENNKINPDILREKWPEPVEQESRDVA
jgi:Fe-S-cluster containining protein